MIMIRCMKERARQIVFNQDPGFKVISYEQVELRAGVYLCRPIIRELQTGKYFQSSFQFGTGSFDRPGIKPYENDDPVFKEINYRRPEPLRM